LTLSAERQKKTVNPTLKGYGSSFRVEELTLGSHVKARDQGLVSYLWNNDWAIFSKNYPGHVQVLKSCDKETEFFHLCNYFLNKVVARQTINAG
jgi:hypothetical protein